MTKLIAQPDLSTAWLESLKYLHSSGGKAVNLVTVIQTPGIESLVLRKVLDQELVRLDRSPVNTVANTIFPADLYRVSLGSKARQHLYETYMQAWPLIKKYDGNTYGTYFQRLIAWQGRTSVVNQLERVIQRLNQTKFGSAYELGLSDPEIDGAEESAWEMRLNDPKTDARTMGFPCLSHVSLTREGDMIHMTAVYRNQYFLQKAYGNYLGLSRLLDFICRETNHAPGELVCIATHADGELSTKQIGELIGRAEEKLLKEAVGAS